MTGLTGVGPVYRNLVGFWMGGDLIILEGSLTGFGAGKGMGGVEGPEVRAEANMRRIMVLSSKGIRSVALKCGF